MSKNKESQKTTPQAESATQNPKKNVPAGSDKRGGQSSK